MEKVEQWAEPTEFDLTPHDFIRHIYEILQGEAFEHLTYHTFVRV
jgi:hypothetical protein